MLLSLTGRGGGMARGRMLNRHPASLQQSVRVSVFADPKNGAGLPAVSRALRGQGPFRFTHNTSQLVPPVVSVSPTSVIPPVSSGAFQLLLIG